MSRGSISVAIVALALAASLTIWALAVNADNGNSSVLSSGNPGAPNGAQERVLSLHSPQYVESAINHTLILPSLATLGASFRITGVSLDLLNLTATNGYQWGVTIYIWNGAFVNGTTTDRAIQQANGVIISEVGFPPSKQLTQETLPEPPVSCVSPVNGNPTCTTQTNTGRNYLVTQNGETILVNPDAHVLWLTFPATHTVVTIFGGSHSVAQMLELANTIS